MLASSCAPLLTGIGGTVIDVRDMTGSGMILVLPLVLPLFNSSTPWRFPLLVPSDVVVGPQAEADTIGCESPVYAMPGSPIYCRDDFRLRSD